MDDTALVDRVPRFRSLLDASNDPRDMRMYPTLWSVEFRLVGKSGNDAERQLITEDLKRLRMLDGLQAVIANGAKLIGDEALAKSMTVTKTRALRLMRKFRGRQINDCPFANLPEARSGRLGPGLDRHQNEGLPMAQARPRRTVRVSGMDAG